MNWLLDLYRTNPIAQAIAVISLVCMVGMLVGSVKVRGIGLGNAAVLFAGILIGYTGRPVDGRMLEFVKEAGLILFVFCIGLQLGPGFFASLRQVGLRLNILAAAVVLLGVVLAAGLGWLLGVDPAAVLGLLAGATTNTPSLGAAQQTLLDLPSVPAERMALPALAYAVSYPVAIVGIIATMLLLKAIFRIDTGKEAAAAASRQRTGAEPLERRTLLVENPELEGVTIGSVRDLHEDGVIVSRHKRPGEAEVCIATARTVLHGGDLILAVGTARGLDRYQRIVGSARSENLMGSPGAITHRRVVVTDKTVLGATVHDLGLEKQFGVTATRVTRAGLEMSATPDLRLKFGDVLLVVGGDDDIEKAAQRLGNSLKALNETHFVPLFAGLVAGIALGTLPVSIPGLPQPVRLGLAGGPLIVALVVGRLGRIGRLVWHMPPNANLALRELGISLFFASVGLLAGPRFFGTVFTRTGLVWMAVGACLTVLPILLIGALVLARQRTEFATLAGLLAGSMTDPPALAFANNICGSEAPTVAYATVYPLTTMMRILSAQVLAVLLCG